MMKILFAPLQGYTTGIYRKAHAEIFGSVDAYYAPFLRIENGKPREKDLRDLGNAEIAANADRGTAESADSKCAENDKGNSASYKVVPQIIANSVSEFQTLTEALLQKGYTQIDFNMGCPFPMQINRHRGAGLLSDTQTVQAIMDEIKKISSAANGTTSVKFSVKMRLGQNSPDEAFVLLPILNDAPLAHITLHPRLGKQQYKGALDFGSFERFYSECKHPLVYNGDITSVSQICEMEQRYPKLAGIMIGRGLLARPSLAAEYKQASHLNSAATSQDFLGKILQMHQIIFEHACQTYQGNSQILSHIQSFWEYLEPNIPKKAFKKIKKAGKLNEYIEAISMLQAECKANN